MQIDKEKKIAIVYSVAISLPCSSCKHFQDADMTGTRECQIAGCDVAEAAKEIIDTDMKNESNLNALENQPTEC